MNRSTPVSSAVRTIALGLLITPLLAACGTPSGEPAHSPEVQAAIAAEAQRSGVSEDAVSVVSLNDVEWPNAALGCPQPGMVYAQVVTTGKHLVLSANGEEASYHAGDGEFSYCADPQVP
ncbi:MAG: hypothetical protein Q4F65_01670 [Propionibacteriaceae bacterium]|nr:hypothetical protein [Propionibacteriaceae bacterium]